MTRQRKRKADALWIAGGAFLGLAVASVVLYWGIPLLGALLAFFVIEAAFLVIYFAVT